MKYFVYNPDIDGMQFYDTEKKAVDACDWIIGHYRDEAHEGWDEQVENTCWGEVKQKAEMFGLRDATEEDSTDCETWCDYKLEDVEPLPAGDSDMKTSKTCRGFTLSEFKDNNGVSCSVQKSSSAEEDKIWLGCDNADPTTLIPGKGWTPVDMPDMYNANTRMHLTQDQVKALIPALQHFVDTGDLPSDPIPAADSEVPDASM